MLALRRRALWIERLGLNRREATVYGDWFGSRRRRDGRGRGEKLVVKGSMVLAEGESPWIVCPNDNAKSDSVFGGISVACQRR